MNAETITPPPVEDQPAQPTVYGMTEATYQFLAQYHPESADPAEWDYIF